MKHYEKFHLFELLAMKMLRQFTTRGARREIEKQTDQTIKADDTEELK